MQIDVNKSQSGGSSASITAMLMLLLLSVHAAVGRPDVRPSPFALELQPPLAQPAEAFNGAGVGEQRAVDSYGNPIAGLRPIDTPDGRKVVSAQGLQFEIPTYASGITEIRQPADDLLPPHIGELTTATAAEAAAAAARATARTTRAAATSGAAGTATDAPQTLTGTDTNALVAPLTSNSTRTSTRSPTPTPTSTTHVEPLTTETNEIGGKLVKRNSPEANTNASSTSTQYAIAPPSPSHSPPTFTLLRLNPFAPNSPITLISSASPASRSHSPNPSPSPSPSPSLKLCPCPSPTPSPAHSANPKPGPRALLDVKYSNTNPSQLDAIAVGLAPPTDTSTDPNSFAPAPESASASAPAPIPATSLTPPKHSPSPTTTTVTTDVEVEQAQLVPIQQQQQQQQQQQEESAQEPLVASGTLPEYIRELQRQDPDIGGPVPWTPAPNAAPLSVIAWDLLPPHLTDPAPTSEPLIITEQQPTRYVQGVEDPASHNIHLSLSSGDALTPADPVPQQTQTQGQVSVVPLQRDGPEAHGTNAHVGSTTPSNAGGRFPNRHRGTAHYSTTRSTTTTPRPRSISTSTTQQPQPTTTTTTTTTSTTRRTTTTPRPVTTTTTRRTTTVQPTPRSTTPLDPSTFYKLENNEEYAYTLPPWLQAVTDPDLDVAVTFIVPTDNDQYNHTLAEDLEPPYEPYVDLNNIQLTPPPTARPPPLPTTKSSTTTTTTTTSTSTTRAPTTTTSTRRPTTLRTTNAPSIPTTHSTQPQKPHTTKPQQTKLITTTHHTDLLDGARAGTPTAAEDNPFDSSTVPAWLRDFDYPDVGPGVPYNPDNFKEPASTQAAGGSKPNDFRPQGFEATTPRFPSTPPTPVPTRAASSAFPSKVTLPLPGTVQGIESSPSSSNESPEPPLVLVPPADQPSDETSSSVPQNPSTNSITNFAARFDPQGIQSAAPTQAPKVTVTEDQFPPINGGGSTDGVTKKVEYKKSDEGKVISTPISGQRKDTSTPPTNTGKYTGGFGAPPGLLRPQATGTSGSGANTSPAANSPDSNGGIYVAGSQHEFSNTLKANRARPTVNPGRYTGGFGAPIGVLSVQAEPRPFQQSQQTQQQHHQVASAGSSSHSSRFGGPPGVLIPFDNVQRAGGQ